MSLHLRRSDSVGRLKGGGGGWRDSQLEKCLKHKHGGAKFGSLKPTQNLGAVNSPIIPVLGGFRVRLIPGPLVCQAE